MKQKLFYCLLCITILWMITIFMFSAKNADESRADSSGVGYRIGCMIYEDFEQWETSRQEVFISKIEHPIRKGAHATEYAILGILILFDFVLFKDICKQRNESDSDLPFYEPYATILWKYILLAWMLTTLYACTDEFHQLFVPGRSGQITDVMIDSSGGLAGILFSCLICKLYYFVNCRKNMKKRYKKLQKRC